jgi:tetraacyldisaccharide 4'-kinase
MKTPSFWYQKPGALACALTPLATLYTAGSRLRRAVATPLHAAAPVICVGNIVAGGAGKTPTAIALGRLLRHEGYAPHFVSRGYGGAAQGPLLVDPQRHTAREVGDEPLLLAKRAPCWVGKDKAQTLHAAADEAAHAKNGLVILDDGFQNPTIAPDAALLVIDGATGLGNGKIVPAGPLRETLDTALARATAVVLIGADEHKLLTRLTKPVFEARLRPHIPDDFPDLKPYLAFAGIGRPQKFFASCRDIGLRLAETHSFPDHHLYSDADIASLLAEADAKGLQLLTTTKDWVRLPDSAKLKVAALQVELTFRDPMALLATLQAALAGKR